MKPRIMYIENKSGGPTTGTFGRCVVDGGAIDDKRLQAVPWTPYCQKHQQALEEQRRLRTPTL